MNLFRKRRDNPVFAGSALQSSLQPTNGYLHFSVDSMACKASPLEVGRVMSASNSTAIICERPNAMLRIVAAGAGLRTCWSLVL